jgi:hypothetical protein
MTAIGNINHCSMVLLFARKKEKPSVTQTSYPEKPNAKPKLKGISVGKYELSEGNLKFYAVKGVFKKRWTLVNEFPAAELANVESIDNWLSITWNDVAYSFLHQKKSESFSGLRDQILGLITLHQQTSEKNQKLSQLKAHLIATLNEIFGPVDLSFNILMGLHDKRVNWLNLQHYSDKLMSEVNWTGQTLSPLNVDPKLMNDAITKQVPREVSKEALGILKAIYHYFNTLPNKEDMEENRKLFENTKNAIISYLIINDVLFARATGQKDDPEELAALENALSMLASESNIKISWDDIVTSTQKASAHGSEGGVNYFREILKKQITLL